MGLATNTTTINTVSQQSSSNNVYGTIEHKAGASSNQILSTAEILMHKQSSVAIPKNHQNSAVANDLRGGPNTSSPLLRIGVINQSSEEKPHPRVAGSAAPANH